MTILSDNTEKKYRCVCAVVKNVLYFFQIRDLEAEVFRLLKQNGSQVNNNNNIFERQTSFGEVSRGDPVENLDTKQVSCLDGLSQGLFEPIHNSCNVYINSMVII